MGLLPNWAAKRRLSTSFPQGRYVLGCYSKPASNASPAGLGMGPW